MPNGGTKNGANESQQQKNSGMPNTNVGSHMNIYNAALEEIEKAGINSGNVDLTHQKIALQQYEEEQKQKLAKPKKKNKEMIEQQKRIQEVKDELKMVDWSSLDTSLLDIEKQKKIFEEATHNKKIQEEKRLQEEIAQQQIRLQEEEMKRIQEAANQKRLQEETARREREEITRREREETARREREETAQQEREKTAQRQREETARQEREAARQKRVQEEVARQKRVQQVITRQKRLQQEAAQQKHLLNAQQNRKTCKTYAANDGNDSHSEKFYDSEEFYDTSDSWPDKQKGSPVDTAHVPSNHDDIFSDQYNPSHFADQLKENVTPVIKTHSSPQQGYKPTKPDLQPSNDNPHNLEVGALMQFGNPPCYGIIKWIGSLPDTNCVMAGVELVSCT